MGISLNIGSGQRKFSSPWVNVDVNPKWNPDVVADAASMPMFEDGSADVIVAHHVIEHFGLGEFDSAIRECYRILAPGGRLIVCVPDMGLLASYWLSGKISDYTFFVSCYGAFMDHDADRHRWGFTRWTLIETLNKALSVPWTRIQSFDYGPIPGADIAKDWWILALEAVK